MKKIKYVLVFLWMSHSVFLTAQTQGVIHGRVIDAVSKEPVAFSAILVKGTLIGTETNSSGEFTLSVSAKTSVLVVYQVGYYTREYAVTDSMNDQQLIELKRKDVILNEVVITSQKIDTLQATNHTVFLAFEFYDNYIVALVNKGSKHNVIQLLEESGKIIKEQKAPAGVEEIYKDCFGNVQLLSKDSSYQFYYNYESIVLLKPFPLAVFSQNLKPCQCIVGNYYYFKEISYRNLKNTYYFVNKADIQKKRLFAQAFNTEAISAFNQDFDINYFLDKRRRGYGYNVSLDEMKMRLDEFREKLPLLEEYTYKLNPMKSELIKMDSSFLVVDYTHKLLHTHNFLGGCLKTDTIHLKGLSPFTVQDIDLKKVYFVRETDGLIDLIEYRNPWISPEKIEIKNFRYLKNIRCRQNTLYFLNRNELKDGSCYKIFKYRL